MNQVKTDITELIVDKLAKKHVAATERPSMNSEAAALRKRLRESNSRAQKSCGPCRARKLRCNRATPCVRCIKSGYPELCLYDVRTGPSASATSDPLQGRFADANFSTHSRDLEHATRSPNRRALPTDGAEQSGVEGRNDKHLFLGANSLPEFLDGGNSLVGSSENATREGARNAMMPMLGMTPPVPGYPFFVPSDSLEEHAITKLCRALPPSKDIIRLFRTYQMEIHPFMPLLVQVGDFEKEICEYVQRRRQHVSPLEQGSRSQRLQGGMSMAWVSTMFALLACGAQFSNEAAPERQQQSSLYVSCALESLRLANFLLRPSILCVQAMLLVGLVLQNDMRPQAAWAHLGMTIRMAQSLGLHKAEAGESTQRLLWLALIRQDGLLGACFDRRPTSPLGSTQLDPYLPSQLSHKSAMDHMTDLILRSDIMADESRHPDLKLRKDLASALNAIQQKTQMDRTCHPVPTDIQFQCQVHHLDLQFGFVKAWVCRPALRDRAAPEATTQHVSVQQEVVGICLQSLRECLYAFVRLNPLCIYACRSWSVVHNGLSSSLLLALTGELRRDSHLQAALGELIDTFEDNPTTPESEDHTRDHNTNLSPAHTRAILALKKIYLRDKNFIDLGHNESAASHTGARRRIENVTIPSGLVQASRELPNERLSSTGTFDQTFLPDIDFMSGVPPLDAFDSIFWPSNDTATLAMDDDLGIPWLY